MLDLAGPPRTAFRRALERGNLLLAEATAREVGRIDLREALELAALGRLTSRPGAERPLISDCDQENAGYGRFILTGMRDFRRGREAQTRRRLSVSGLR